MGEVQYRQSAPLVGLYMCDGQVTQAEDAVLPVLAVHRPDDA